jgi:hypothetical protein
MEISAQDFETLRLLEEGLWRADVRFDREKMDRILAPDFFEFGRSGRAHERADTLGIPAQQIRAKLPLPDFKVRLLGPDIAQVTYINIVTYEHGKERAQRSSIWSRTHDGWQLKFHQGTAIPRSNELWPGGPATRRYPE